MRALSKALALAYALSGPATIHVEAARPPVRRAVKPQGTARAKVVAKVRTSRRAPIRATVSPAEPPAAVVDLGPAIARRILDLVNEQRAFAGLAALAWDDRLAQAASGHAQAQTARGIVDHVVDGRTPLDRVLSAGYPALHVGENLFGAYPVAQSLSLADEIVAAWMDSPDHRANILSPSFSEVGVAVLMTPAPASRGAFTLLAVQDFGRPDR